MSHVFEKAEKLTATALALLDRQVVLANIISRDSGAEFTGAKGDTVNIKRPSRLTGAEQALRADNAGGIQSENLNEWSIPVRLDRHIYSAVDLTDAELTLDVANFAEQVLAPQTNTVARRIERATAAQLMNSPSIGEVQTDEHGDPVDAQAVRRALVKARNRLNRQDVPLTSRYAIVGADIESALLNDPVLVPVDTSGSSEVLREATIGRLAGFNIVVSNDIDPRTAICLHPSAYVLVNRAPVVPVSAQGSSSSVEGLAVRLVRDYNSHTASDRSFVSSYIGFGEVLDAPETSTNPARDAVQMRAVSFRLADAATPGGGE
ncbi:P22 phage major capsid protein family protein [Streptomyces sp. NPDC057555]|uniref:P22 phage major capsid protein family protein n=1 Tax=Streptomyces sp. NPDC057555 TaxID=3346166 RepID=UPI003677D0E8